MCDNNIQEDEKKSNATDKNRNSKVYTLPDGWRALVSKMASGKVPMDYWALLASSTGHYLQHENNFSSKGHQTSECNV